MGGWMHTVLCVVVGPFFPPRHPVNTHELNHKHINSTHDDLLLLLGRLLLLLLLGRVAVPVLCCVGWDKGGFRWVGVYMYVRTYTQAATSEKTNRIQSLDRFNPFFHPSNRPFAREAATHQGGFFSFLSLSSPLAAFFICRLLMPPSPPSPPPPLAWLPSRAASPPAPLFPSAPPLVVMVACASLSVADCSSLSTTALAAAFSLDAGAAIPSAAAAPGMMMTTTTTTASCLLVIWKGRKPQS